MHVLLVSALRLMELHTDADDYFNTLQLLKSPAEAEALGVGKPPAFSSSR